MYPMLPNSLDNLTYNGVLNFDADSFAKGRPPRFSHVPQTYLPFEAPLNTYYPTIMRPVAPHKAGFETADSFSREVNDMSKLPAWKKYLAAGIGASLLVALGLRKKSGGKIRQFFSRSKDVAQEQTKTKSSWIKEKYEGIKNVFKKGSNEDIVKTSENVNKKVTKEVAQEVAESKTTAKATEAISETTDKTAKSTEGFAKKVLNKMKNLKGWQKWTLGIGAGLLGAYTGLQMLAARAKKKYLERMQAQAMMAEIQRSQMQQNNQQQSAGAASPTQGANTLNNNQTQVAKAQPVQPAQTIQQSNQAVSQPLQAEFTEPKSAIQMAEQDRMKIDDQTAALRTELAQKAVQKMNMQKTKAPAPEVLMSNHNSVNPQ